MLFILITFYKGQETWFQMKLNLFLFNFFGYRNYFEVLKLERLQFVYIFETSINSFCTFKGLKILISPSMFYLILFVVLVSRMTLILPFA